MSPSARSAHLDFARLACDEGASSFFEEFLKEGTASWDTGTHALYPGLSAWHGVTELKRQLRCLVGTDPSLPLLLAARSAQLVKLAARLLFHPCRNVLVTDLCWLPYRDVLAREANRAGRLLTEIKVRDDLLHSQIHADEVAERIVSESRAAGCDGVFLSAVGHLGFRLPVEQIIERLGGWHGLRVVVIDGSQEFCNVSADLGAEHCDLYLTGCHKWLGAHHPLGLGFYGRRRSAPVIETLLSHLRMTGEIDDPLLRFTTQLESDSLDGITETVNLMPLFSCLGAVHDSIIVPDSQATRLDGRLRNLDVAVNASTGTGWSPIVSDPSLRSGILLLRANRAETRSAEPAAIRSAFGREGIALSVYPEGLLRVSMPEHPLSGSQISSLEAALRRIA